MLHGLSGTVSYEALTTSCEYALTGIGAVEVILACDAAKTKPGQQGNLLIEAFATRAGASGGNKNRTNQRVPLGVLPAIPFEIVAAGGGGR